MMLQVQEKRRDLLNFEIISSSSNSPRTYPASKYRAPRGLRRTLAWLTVGVIPILGILSQVFTDMY